MYLKLVDYDPDFGENGELKSDGKTFYATGTLPEQVFNLWGKATVLIERSTGDFFPLTSKSVKERSNFLLKAVHEVEHKMLEGDADRPKRWPNNPMPRGIGVKYPDGSKEVLFFPPNCWKLASWTSMSICGCDYDFELYFENYAGSHSAVINLEESKSIKTEGQDKYLEESSYLWDLEWLGKQATQDPIKLDSETRYKTFDLQSPGHKTICEILEKKQIMFFFEAPCVLPGDTKTYRRVDLIVIKNKKAVIVEIDGSYHGREQQRRDDNERDRLINNFWANKIRFTHEQVMEDPQECVKRILDSLDPNIGVIS